MLPRRSRHIGASISTACKLHDISILPAGEDRARGSSCRNAAAGSGEGRGEAYRAYPSCLPRWHADRSVHCRL